MAEIVITVDVDIDLKGGKFAYPCQYENVKRGLPVLESIIGDRPVTLFMSGRCLLDDKILAERVTDNVEIGCLFYPGDYDPKKESLSGGFRQLSCLDMTADSIRTHLRSMVDTFEKFISSGVRVIRVGMSELNVDTLEILGEDEWPFTHSSSTIPGNLSDDGRLDHRLLKNDPYQVGKIVEVPLSTYGSNREAWMIPITGFGMTENFCEIARKAPVVNISIPLSSLVVGYSSFSKDQEEVDATLDKIDLWFTFAEKKGMEFKFLSDIKPISLGI